MNQNSNIKISNLSDSSIIKKNKKSKNNNISSTEDPGSIHIQTFREKNVWFVCMVLGKEVSLQI